MVLELPKDARLLDVDGIPVALLPDGSCVAYELKTGKQRPYQNGKKTAEGDTLTTAEFQAWIVTGHNKFDVL